MLISSGIYNVKSGLKILVDAVELKSTLFPNIPHRLTHILRIDHQLQLYFVIYITHKVVLFVLSLADLK